MDFYNEYKTNSIIDLCSYGDVKKTTHIQKVWTDSIGDIHLDVQIDRIKKDGSGFQFVLPDLCIPMDGTIHTKTLREPLYCAPITQRAWYEPKRDIQLNEGFSNSALMPSVGTTGPYVVAVQCVDAPVKEMTLEEIEQKLGYKVKVVSAEKK